MKKKFLGLALLAGFAATSPLYAAEREWTVSFCPLAPVKIIAYQLNVAQTEITLHPAIIDPSDVTYIGTAAVFRNGITISIFDPKARTFRVVEEFDAEFFACYETDELSDALATIQSSN